MTRASAEGGDDADMILACLRKLTKAANEVSRCGATTGPQWTALTMALLSAKAALARATGEQP